MRYICKICGYSYDEEKEDKLFKDLEKDWLCPLCKARKEAFEEEKANKEEEISELNTKEINEKAELKNFTYGQLAAICSNLARGLEKQYKYEEASLFNELAKYFITLEKPIADAKIEELADLLLEDLENYPHVRKVADIEADRGAKRICVWGEKVTMMLSSIINRYLKEGEAMLEDNDIYLCTVCGFIYIGKKAPELCPVCKVLPYKFEKI